MHISVTSILVDDQEKALAFYTTKLGFIKKHDIPMGEYKWLTVVSGDVDNGIELLLEPTAFEPSKVYQKALFDANIPITMFTVTNVQSEVIRLAQVHDETAKYTWKYNYGNSKQNKPTLSIPHSNKGFTMIIITFKRY